MQAWQNVTEKHKLCTKSAKICLLLVIFGVKLSQIFDIGQFCLIIFIENVLKMLKIRLKLNKLFHFFVKMQKIGIKESNKEQEMVKICTLRNCTCFENIPKKPSKTCKTSEILLSKNCLWLSCKMWNWIMDFTGV